MKGEACLCDETLGRGEGGRKACNSIGRIVFENEFAPRRCLNPRDHNTLEYQRTISLHGRLVGSSCKLTTVLAAEQVGDRSKKHKLSTKARHELGTHVGGPKTPSAACVPTKYNSLFFWLGPSDPNRASTYPHAESNACTYVQIQHGSIHTRQKICTYTNDFASIRHLPRLHALHLRTKQRVVPL